MTTPTSRRLLPVLILLPLLAIGGAATGLWSGHGVGAGQAATGTTVAVTLTPGVPAASLYPGGAADVVLTVLNPNTSSVHIGRLVLDTGQGQGGYAVDPAHSGCAVTTFTYTTQTNGGAGWDVPAKVGVVDGSLAVTLPSALAMSLAAANACQGATSTVYLAAAL